MPQGIKHQLLNQGTATVQIGTPVRHNPSSSEEVTKAIHVILQGTGAISATVLIEVANDSDAASWLTLETLTLSGTTAVSDGLITDTPYWYVRANLTAISGTGATIHANMAV